MSKRRNIRKRASSEGNEESNDGDGEADDLRQKLEATRAVQKHRQRGQGAGDGDNEFMGGYIKEQVRDPKSEVDPEREKYIKEQLDRRLGRLKDSEGAEAPATAADNVYAIPAALRTQKTNQEDVSAWMTGIVEVPLSVGHKLKNIEDTEAAKKQLLRQAGSRPVEEDPMEPAASKQGGMMRISYPLRFGKQTDKEEDWRARAIQKSSLQPKERKRKRPPH